MVASKSRIETKKDKSPVDMDFVLECFSNLKDIPLGIVLIDKEGIIRFLNTMGGHFIGVQPAMAIGRPTEEIMSEPHLIEAVLSGVEYRNALYTINGFELLCHSLPIIIQGRIICTVQTMLTLPSHISQANNKKYTLSSIEREYVKGLRFSSNEIPDRNFDRVLPKAIRKLGRSCMRSSSLRKIYGSKFCFDDIIGQSEGILDAKKRAECVARGDSTVLISGESGTGKELFAQAIHLASPRRNGPFVRVNCAGIPESLVESELFGYEPGSFTSAEKSGKPGKFELAHNGTIFLDEVGDMPLQMQAKILRVIQESEIERVGGTVTYQVDVRIIAATNRDLWKLVEKRKFREDLLHRLDVANIHIPPLREHRDDIPLLVEHIIPTLRNCTNSEVSFVGSEVLEHLRAYDWPGNVRELYNVLEGAMNFKAGRLIKVEDLPLKVRKGLVENSKSESIQIAGGRFGPEDQRDGEKTIIIRALSMKNGNKRQTASYLNMSRSTLYYKLKKYKIDHPGISRQRP